MEAKPIAVVTFFSKTTCGYCKQFKGEIKDEKTGVVTIDPNSGWETLTSDLDLQQMGVVFNLYQFGPEEDPKTGKVLNYVLAAPYSDRGRINGVPHLEVSIPGDPTKFVPFNPSGLASWKAEHSVPLMKEWIMTTLQTEPFKNYAAAVRSGRVPPPTQAQPPAQSSHPVQQAQRPMVPMDNSAARIAQVQAQQRAYEQNSRGEQGSQYHQHHAHAPHQHYHGGDQQGPAQHARQVRQAQNQHRSQHQVEQHNAPTTFGMGTRQIKPVVTPASVPVSPARRNANPAPTPKTVEKPKPRFVPANADE